MNILYIDFGDKEINRIDKKIVPKLNEFFSKIPGIKKKLNYKNLFASIIYQSIRNPKFFYNIFSDLIAKFLLKFYSEYRNIYLGIDSYYLSIRNCIIDSMERVSGDIMPRDNSKIFIQKYRIIYFFRSLKIIFLLELIKIYKKTFKLNMFFMPQLDGYPNGAITSYCIRNNLYLGDYSYEIVPDIYSTKSKYIRKLRIMIRKDAINVRLAIANDIQLLKKIDFADLDIIIKKIRDQFIFRKDPVCNPKIINQNVNNIEKIHKYKSLLDNRKKTAIVMLHHFTDQSRIRLENTWLESYLDWAIETIEICKKNKEINWIFKSHPYESRYPINENCRNKIINSIKQNGFIHIESNEDLLHSDVEKLASVIVTCNGSCKLEYPALFGIPVISCIGRLIPYDPFVLPFTAKNYSEYEYLLMNAHNVKLSTKEKRKFMDLLAFQKILGGKNIEDKVDVLYYKDFNGDPLIRNF